MAELVMHLIVRTAADLQHQPVSDEDRSEAAAALRAPMLPGNHAAHTNLCLMGPALKSERVIASQGWDWVNESKSARPKWGYVSTTPGKRLEVKLNTTATSGGREREVMVKLAYLASYEHMGMAVVR
jgi:hypothetical protein